MKYLNQLRLGSFRPAVVLHVSVLSVNQIGMFKNNSCLIGSCPKIKLVKKYRYGLTCRWSQWINLSNLSLLAVTRKVYFYPRAGFYFRMYEDGEGWHLIPYRISPRSEFFLRHIRTGILCGGSIYVQSDRRWQGVSNFTLSTHPPGRFPSFP